MLIILNGPPGVGKDTIGEKLAQYLSCSMLSFKEPMWEIARAFLGEGKFKTFVELYNNRETKEMPQEYLGHRSPREFFIWISENICKPAFGQEYFGERMLEIYSQVARDNPCSASVVTDGGFPRELFPFVKEGHQVFIVRLHRKDYTFAGDSRSYLQEESFAFFPAHLRPRFIDIELIEGKVDFALHLIKTQLEV